MKPKPATDRIPYQTASRLNHGHPGKSRGRNNPRGKSRGSTAPGSLEPSKAQKSPDQATAPAESTQWKANRTPRGKNGEQTYSTHRRDGRREQGQQPAGARGSSREQRGIRRGRPTRKERRCRTKESARDKPTKPNT